MENASKALIMAGSVLIGVIVVSLFMVMANSLTDYQQTQTQNQREAQIISFNNSYEGYIRDNVQGYELMSLVNKVVDYNKRQSTLGTEKDEQGQDLGFDPIELTIDFGTEKLRKEKLARNDSNELFKSNIYYFKKSNIDSEIQFNDIVKDILNAKLPVCNWHNSPNRYEPNKDFYFTEDKLQTLLDNYDTIFAYVDYNQARLKNISKEEKLKALNTFNTAFGENYFQLKRKNGNTFTALDDDDYWYIFSTWLKKDSTSRMVTSATGKKYTIWKTLNIYYEYDQFKRAVFECDKSQVGYSSTGRINKLYFKFTGKID